MERADELQLLFAKAFESAIPDDDCPDPDVILDARSGRSDAEQRRQVVLHLGACPVCAEAWRLANRVLEPGP